MPIIIKTTTNNPANTESNFTLDAILPGKSHFVIVSLDIPLKLLFKIIIEYSIA